MLLGSDRPFDMGTDNPVEQVRALGLGAGEELVLGGNARRLLGELMTEPGGARHSAAQHGGALLASLLAEHGVRHVFGVPGGQTLALYDGILDREPELQHVLTRDERSAAYAADGYARVTGQVGVCDATVGPGAAKLPSGLAEALGASVPVVALVSELPARMAGHRYRSAASQALDQVALLAPVTKWQATVPDAAAMPALVRHAFREAASGRPGPVALFLPQDVLDGPAPACAVPAGPAPAGPGHSPSGGSARFGWFPAFRPAPDSADVAAAAAVLRAAQRPFVLAGGGVLHSGAGAELTRWPSGSRPRWAARCPARGRSPRITR